MPARRPFLAGTPFQADRAVVVVAHPDDETIGCGAQLGSGEVHLAVVTDGAPRDLFDAHAHGFADADGYARARRRELDAALAAAGLPGECLHCLDVPDQRAAHRMPEIAGALVRLIADLQTDLVATHAYEGGHPDHDATAFAVHAAAALLAASGRAIPIVEMPYYRAQGEGVAYQRFAPEDEGMTIALSPESQAKKRRMLAMHATQREVLLPFSTIEERFRRAPAYDFTRLPNGGALLYERYDWGLAGADWLRLAPAALRSLGLGRRTC